MYEITVISGKGGAGKSSITASLCLQEKEIIACDLDVDAADLHLLFHPQITQTNEFISGSNYRIDPEKCTACGICYQYCNFGAVDKSSDDYSIDAGRCEDCSVCSHFCPEGAIIKTEKHCGQWFRSKAQFGDFLFARLTPGEENSGRLVTLLRSEAKKLAKEKDVKYIINDGSPGIGCPVISSLSGVNLAVIVCEPTPSGFHDLKRVAELCSHFSVKAAIILNKADLNSEIAAEIKTYCKGQKIAEIAEIPFDRRFSDAINSGKAVVELKEATELKTILEQTWTNIKEVLHENDNSNTGSK